MQFFYFLILLLLPFAVGAQQSTFDTDNEDWGADGDPLGPVAGWAPTGGLPGGHIRVTDAATGGTWYFVAPAKFRGNKCGAYDHMFSYDQFTSDTSNQIVMGNRADVEIWGNGLKLMFDNAENPGLNWTHYQMLLREDAGWRLNDLNGPVPTEAEFRLVLSNITRLRIKGEYRPASDFGGLDNVILQNTFDFDLDGDDSSGAGGGDFASDTLCTPEAPVADADAILISEFRVDSMTVRVLGGSSSDLLVAGALPSTVSVGQSSTAGSIVLIGNGNASTADFIQALLAVQYRDISPDPVRGERLIGVQVFTECGDMGIHFAYLPIFPPPDAGLDGDTVICANSGTLRLHSVLGGAPDAGGFWSPRPGGGPDLFDPLKDSPGTYFYIIPDAGVCPGDTAQVDIDVAYPPTLVADTTLCHTDTLLLKVPESVLTWQWNDGSHRRDVPVTFPGTYTLTGTTAYCTFTDSVRIGFYTCETCVWYAPNIFSPDDDGVNDRWHIFL
ncbi:MAG: hypothetical protein IT262_16495, partial [Saprospiraceae bacterium]|nr:hypothetical protein [Saprospiraceae bacterium]